MRKDKSLFLDRVAAFLSFVLNLLFPPKCAICRDLLYREHGELCPDCLKIWESARRAKCPVCQKTAKACTCSLFSVMNTDPIGERKLSSLVFFGKADSDDIKDLATRKIIYSAKTSSDISATRLCARELSLDILKTLTLGGEKPESWKLTYPPRTKRRIRKYGFDQGADLARLVSKYTGIPIEKTLENSGRSSQKKLNALERKTNATASYSLRKGVSPSGKYIIVDDVITTGATVNSAALLLKENGALAVYPACIARTKNKKRKVRRPSDRPWFRSV